MSPHLGSPSPKCSRGFQLAKIAKTSKICQDLQKDQEAPELPRGRRPFEVRAILCAQKCPPKVREHLEVRTILCTRTYRRFFGLPRPKMPESFPKSPKSTNIGKIAEPAKKGTQRCWQHPWAPMISKCLRWAPNVCNRHNASIRIQYPYSKPKLITVRIWHWVWELRGQCQKPSQLGIGAESNQQNKYSNEVLKPKLKYGKCTHDANPTVGWKSKDWSPMIERYTDQ